MTKAKDPAGQTPDAADAPVGQAPVPQTYEAALRELEELVRSMEAGELPLDQLLSAYQRGAVLLQSCRDRLQAVEAQVKVLDDGALSAWKAQ